MECRIGLMKYYNFSSEFSHFITPLPSAFFLPILFSIISSFFFLLPHDPLLGCLSFLPSHEPSLLSSLLTLSCLYLHLPIITHMLVSHYSHTYLGCGYCWHACTISWITSSEMKTYWMKLKVTIAYYLIRTHLLICFI